MRKFRLMTGGMALMLAVLTVTDATAQARRTTTTRRPATRTTTTTQKPAAKKTVKTIACYETKAKTIAVGSKYIYYVENNNNNAVISINRETGEKETVVAGIAGIYEGARPRIYSVNVCGEQLILETKTDFLLWDGKSVESSMVIKGCGQVISTTDKRLLLVNAQTRNYQLWDAETMQMIVDYAKYNTKHNPIMPSWDGLTPPRIFIASDDALWYNGSNMYVDKISRIDKDGNLTDFVLTKEEYVVKNNLNGKIGRMSTNGDSLYVCKKRRLYRMNMLSPGTWEEYAKIPVNENKTFERAYADSKGNVMTRGEAYANYNIEYYKADALDTPQALGKDNFPSGLDVWDRTAIWWSLCYYVGVDDKDNFLYFTDAGVLYIYRPDGVVGYAKGVGTVIK